MTIKNVLASALIATLASAAVAETTEERTMLNAARIATSLDTVLPDYISTVISRIESGSLKRIAPEQPIWILETIDGTILYYQGQPSFKNQPAAALIDDDGNRFGLTALQHARNANSKWITVNLTGKPYRAYCHTLNPFVVCSLML